MADGAKTNTEYKKKQKNCDVINKQNKISVRLLELFWHMFVDLLFCSPSVSDS